MVTKVQKWGNSQRLPFTKSVLEEARINVGDQVRVSVQEGRIIVEPVSRVRGRHDLRALVSRMPQGVSGRRAGLGAPSRSGSMVDVEVCSRERGLRHYCVQSPGRARAEGPAPGPGGQQHPVQPPHRTRHGVPTDQYLQARPISRRGHLRAPVLRALFQQLSDPGRVPAFISPTL